MEVRADVTIQDIRAQLSGERPLPPFHEIRLLQGERELEGSNNAIEVELQAVVTVEPCKALAELDSLLDKATPRF